jgi:hypothetical protein
LVGTAKLVCGANARASINVKQRIIFLIIQFLLGYGPLGQGLRGFP